MMRGLDPAAKDGRLFSCSATFHPEKKQIFLNLLALGAGMTYQFFK